MEGWIEGWIGDRWMDGYGRWVGGWGHSWRYFRWMEGLVDRDKYESTNGRMKGLIEGQGGRETACYTRTAVMKVGQ